MMICPRCHNVMSHVFRFTPDRNCELDITKEKVKKAVEKPKNKSSKKKHKKGKKK